MLEVADKILHPEIVTWTVAHVGAAVLSAGLVLAFPTKRGSWIPLSVCCASSGFWAFCVVLWITGFAKDEIGRGFVIEMGGAYWALLFWSAVAPGIAALLAYRLRWRRRSA